jgi:dihydropteroate synthase
VIGTILPGSGIDLVNDMSGLPDERNARLCAQAGVSLLIMHSVGEPKVPHLAQQWDDIMGELDSFFDEKITLAEKAGLDPEAILIDPGIDFAKQREDNLTIFRELGRLRRFSVPVLVPVSRKTVIGEVLELPDPVDRDAGTVACITACMERGAEIFRVHDVSAAWQTVKAIHPLA